ncbi:MAG: tyrosine-protein phosphatase [Chloroflexi bacterium]|nr:tyrosine-protein phosphatase [Chloroflexota bacterium]
MSYRHIPFLTQGAQIREFLWSISNMGEFYVNVIERPHFGPKLVEALRVAAEPHAGPTVFHRTAGRDRTGMFSAFLLGILGVRDDDIVRDYALSAPHMEKLKESLSLDPEGASLIAETPAHSFEADPDSMEMLLDYINRKYGSAKGYVSAHGGHEDLFAALEDALLE